jgi:hypothetical protein
MIVELMGLPGSGKSFFAKELGKESNWTYISFKNKREVFKYFLLGILNNPIFFIAGFWFARKVLTDRYLFWNCYVVKYAKFAAAKRAPTEHAVIDEGAHQNVISYSRFYENTDFIKRYFTHCPRPDKLIVLAPPNTLLEIRWQKRIEAAHPTTTTISELQRKKMKTAFSFFLEFAGNCSDVVVCTDKTDNFEIKRIILN